MTTTGANTRRGLRAVLAVFVLALTGLAVGASPAAAARPCWNQVLNDWFVDGRIDGTYPIRCYTQAQQHIGEDAKQYSTAPQDIQRALLAAIHHRGSGGGKGTGTSGGGGGNASGGGGGGSAATGGGGNASGSGSGSGSGSAKAANKGPLTRAIDWLGPSNADSIPLPLLVLAGIALLLLAGAAASWFARRYQARRLRPVSQPPQPPEQP